MRTTNENGLSVLVLDYVVAGLSRAELSCAEPFGSATQVGRVLPRRAVSIDYSRSLAQELSSVGAPQSFSRDGLRFSGERARSAPLDSRRKPVVDCPALPCRAVASRIVG